MAAPAVEPLAVAASGDCVPPKKGALNMSRKCVLSQKGLLRWQGQG
jgi:hypothetical protein